LFWGPRKIPTARRAPQITYKRFRFVPISIIGAHRAEQGDDGPGGFSRHRRPREIARAIFRVPFSLADCFLLSFFLYYGLEGGTATST
jgi:hypothetical protein